MFYVRLGILLAVGLALNVGIRVFPFGLTQLGICLVIVGLVLGLVITVGSTSAYLRPSRYRANAAFSAAMLAAAFAFIASFDVGKWMLALTVSGTLAGMALHLSGALDHLLARKVRTHAVEQLTASS